MKLNYQARNKEGQVFSGVVEASSKEAAVLFLQRRGLYVTVLEPVGKPPIYARRIKFLERTPKKDVVLFSRQLSIMFKTKVPLVEALQVLAAQNKNPNFKEKLFNISEQVQGGTSLSDALKKYPELFSSFYVSMLKSGEASGKLSESLEYLANHLEREYDLENKIKSAMTYPALILVFVLGVLFLMVFYIVPSLTEVLQETGQELLFLVRDLMIQMIISGNMEVHIIVQMVTYW